MFFNNIKLAYRLGFINLFRVFLYRTYVKVWVKKDKIKPPMLNSGVFYKQQKTSIEEFFITESNQITKFRYFDHKYHADNDIPNWHRNILTDKVSSNADSPWWAIGDFNLELGDIKGVWEASRFNWLICFAQQAKSGQDDGLLKLNAWLNDWITQNQLYNGVNWKCGQEASIRVMHLALGALLLDQTRNSSPTLLGLLKAHLKRISPTVIYAMAQDNNHGTSEGAALYIGGSWLALNGDEEGNKWQKQGLRWLENRAAKLIEEDGSFSQYSVTYHRVMLDTYSLVEVWRKNHGLTVFSDSLYRKLKAATNWLFYFTNINTGDAPNLGANDGARLIQLTNTDYRDFRPSVQLANKLFYDKLAYDGEGSFNSPLYWLQLKKPNEIVPNKTPIDFDNGGYVYLTNSHIELFLRYPKFKFRPSQCDALHIDLWLNNENVFRDGGTYSYNAGQKYIDYYGGVESHNSVQFDDHQQMPRLSRFLLGDWITTTFKKPLLVDDNIQTFGVGYKDRFSCKHKRFIELSSHRLLINDELSGFKNKAVLRFRLAPSNWQLVNNSLSSKLCVIKFAANVEIKRLELTSGYESRYYYQESKIPVIELEIDKSGTLTTEIIF